jgi:pilus assembly protein CpaD
VASRGDRWRHDRRSDRHAQRAQRGGGSARSPLDPGRRRRTIRSHRNRPLNAWRGLRRLATLRLHYPKVTADAGPCGLWPYDLGPTYDPEHFENRQYYNFDAHQRNLAAMVDNPADLVQPRGESPSYTARRTTVLEKYRKGEATATVYPDASKGKVSEVGQ